MQVVQESGRTEFVFEPDCPSYRQRMLAKRVESWQRAEEAYGWPNQLAVASEELAEAGQQISKQARGVGDLDALAEEIADAYNVLGQLVLHYGINDRVEYWRARKTDRLLRRIEEDLRHGET